MTLIKLLGAFDCTERGYCNGLSDELVKEVETKITEICKN
jgi:hypothetical protein